MEGVMSRNGTDVHVCTAPACGAASGKCKAVQVTCCNGPLKSGRGFREARAWLLAYHKANRKWSDFLESAWLVVFKQSMTGRAHICPDVSSMHAACIPQACRTARAYPSFWPTILHVFGTPAACECNRLPEAA
eukprot:365596-Chlamydomonas_euryale.AAC.37